MRSLRVLCALCVSMLTLLFPLFAGAQTSAPRWNDLPKLAAKWPPEWAALVRDAATARDFEDEVLKRVGELLKAVPTPEAFRLADIVLSATLRHSQSSRRAAPLVDNSSSGVQLQLADRLAKTRHDWLLHLSKNDKDDEALQRADQWLPIAAKGGPVQTAILALWTQQAQKSLDKADYAAARSWLNRIETHFDSAEAINHSLRSRAETLLNDSKTMPDAQAVRTLEEALALWPRLVDARDELERRKGTYRSLLVAARSLPQNFSPATAATEIEKQSLELLFDRLYRVEYSNLGKRPQPQLATALLNDGRSASLELRRNAYWSTGERVTAADIRHTALMMNQNDAAGRSALWRDFLELPRSESGAFQVDVSFRKGLFDSHSALSFWIIPQTYRGKQMQRADDPEFAKAPIGSGPFQLVGRKLDGGKPHVVFHVNSHDLRPPVASIREIRIMAWTDAKKDFPKPPPHLVIDPPVAQRPVLKQLGYTDITATRSSAVWTLAVNHRKTALASVAVRRAIAHSLDRPTLLNRHFRAEKDVDHATANGLFPRGSWAVAPAPRVPAELFQAEQAASFARQVKLAEALSLTLKYANDDPRAKPACDDIAQSITATFQDAKIPCTVQAIGLAPHVLRKAILERDYDLAYTSVEGLDDPVRLALFFDRQEDATRAGGANFLGVDSDVKLNELLRGVTQHQQFSVLQEAMQAVHVHLYETMPIIPLWQLDVHVMAHPSLRTPALDVRALFANIREWKVVQ